MTSTISFASQGTSILDGRPLRTGLSNLASSDTSDVDEKSLDRKTQIIVAVVALVCLGLAVLAFIGLVLYGWRRDNKLGRFIRRMFFCCDRPVKKDRLEEDVKLEDLPKSARPPSFLTERPISRLFRAVEARQQLDSFQQARRKSTALKKATVSRRPDLSPMSEHSEPPTAVTAHRTSLVVLPKVDEDKEDDVKDMR